MEELGPQRAPPGPAPEAPPPLDPVVEAQLDKWVEAKRRRDFTTADYVRSQLEAKGIKPEQVRPHVWEPPGSRAGRMLGTHAPRPGSRPMIERGPSQGSAPMPMPPMGASSNAPPSNIDPSVGDWRCTACGNWNWARRRECNQCNAAKDGLMAVKGAASGTKRVGEGGGFKEFDAEEDAHRKRRAQALQQQKEERKAEKRKCEYCKRFSCIC